MFVDRVRVKVTSGKGGKGCCSFRREAHVPLGGPNGGDGGDGGHIFFRASARLTTLLDLRYHSNWVGKRGAHGLGKDQHGKNGQDTYVELPLGTVIHDFETGEVLVDLVEEGQTWRAARGGRGGRGNARFASANNRAPHFAEMGEPGEEHEYLLELKLIADVGLVGLPNAGKSTFLSAVSAAKPKIADYPFTTLTPNLGVVSLPDHRTLTVADIPGIIEGAAEGKGLGHDFLRHIERTRALLFLIDLGDENPMETVRILKNELKKHSETLAERPCHYAFNKIDLPDNRQRYLDMQNELPEDANCISAVTGEGTRTLLETLWRTVEEMRRKEAEEEMSIITPQREYTFKPPFEIDITDGGFRVIGEKPLQAVAMTDFDREEAVMYLQKRLEKMGVFKALKRMGAQTGQPVFVGNYEMEYHE